LIDAGLTTEANGRGRVRAALAQFSSRLGPEFPVTRAFNLRSPMTVLLETRFAPGGCALHRLTEAGREAVERIADLLA
jgi:hypothetical protein